MKKNNIYITLAAIGAFLPFINFTLSAIYGAVGFILLASVQISLLPSSGKWAIMGGKPIAKIEGKQKTVSIAAVVMLTSVLFGFFINLAWLMWSLPNA
jgi:hypothetical protein